MKTNTIGFRFCPTDEELINYFLKNKILGKSWLVNDTIREVKICRYDPASLPALSMIKSKDPEWYFLALKEYTSPKENLMKRTTPSGFWKPTGNDRNVKQDKRRNVVIIGIKKTLVYHEGNSSNAARTPWTMHEYHITCLPLAVERTYVICKVFYKGKVEDIPSGSNSSEPSHSLVTDDSNTVGATNTPAQVEQAGEESLLDFSVDDVIMITNEQEDLCPWDALYPIPNTSSTENNDNTTVQLQAPCLSQDDDKFLSELTHVNRELVEFLFTDDQEFITQEKCEEYMLKIALLTIAER